MSTFYRFAGLAVVFISFGLLVSALPSPRAEDAAWVITGTDAVSLICADFLVKVKACLDVIAGCQDLVKLKVNILVLVSLCNACAADLLKIGANVKVTADAQASIVKCFAAFLILFVKVFADLSVKFGLTVIVTLCAEIDVCIKALFVALNICLDGVLALIVKECAGAVTSVFVSLKLKLCIALLGL